MKTRHFFRNAISLFLCVLMLAEFVQPAAMAAFRSEQTQEGGTAVLGDDQQTLAIDSAPEKTAPDDALPAAEKEAPDAASPTEEEWGDETDDGDLRWNPFDYLSFGYYPQSLVTDPEMIDWLDQQPKTWKSYGYYLGSATEEGISGHFLPINFDGKMKPRRIMQFADIYFADMKFRPFARSITGNVRKRPAASVS